MLALHAGEGLRKAGAAFAAGAYEIGTFHGAPRAGLDAGWTDDDATTALRPIGWGIPKNEDVPVRVAVRPVRGRLSAVVARPAAAATGEPPVTALGSR